MLRKPLVWSFILLHTDFPSCYRYYVDLSVYQRFSICILSILRSLRWIQHRKGLFVQHNSGSDWWDCWKNCQNKTGPSISIPCRRWVLSVVKMESRREREADLVFISDRQEPPYTSDNILQANGANQHNWIKDCSTSMNSSTWNLSLNAPWLWLDSVSWKSTSSKDTITIFFFHSICMSFI